MRTKRNTKIRTNLAAAALSLVFMCLCVAAGPAATTVKSPPPQNREALTAAVSKALRADREVYIYFYTHNRPESGKWIANVRKWAQKQNADFYALDAESEASRFAAMDYGIAFTPSVLRLKRGYGVVEAHTGPSETARFAKSPATKPIPEFARRVRAITEKNSSVIVEFYADWCASCDEIKPMFQQVETRTGGRIRILRVNVDGELEGIQLYGVASPPENVLLDRDGTVHRRFGRIASPASVLQFAVTAGLVTPSNIR